MVSFQDQFMAVGGAQGIVECIRVGNTAPLDLVLRAAADEITSLRSKLDETQFAAKSLLRPGEWVVLPEKTTALSRSLFGSDKLPPGALVIERPPQNPSEARNVFFEAVIVGFMSEEIAQWVCEAKKVFDDHGGRWPATTGENHERSAERRA